MMSSEMADRPNDPFGARAPLAGHDGIDLYRIARLDETGVASTSALPYTVRVLLEMLLRNAGSIHVTEDDVRALAAWPEPAPAGASVAFLPARVILQDFTGVPAVVDLAAMRSAMARAGADPGRVDPLVPADLVIDHSVQVDAFGTRFAYARNIEREYERNRERYSLLRWAQGAFGSFRVVPPGMGIVHQVNLEHLGRVVQLREDAGGRVAIPDTLVGTDSHTTMIDALGILGWGVGGIEAEAVLLGEPLVLQTPVVIGVEFRGALRVGVTATDLVLTLTEMLRRHGVVGKFVEFCGDGLSALTVPDRATLSNMSPEYGATAATFPVDAETLRYLDQTARGDAVPLVESYTRAQGLFREDGDELPRFSELLLLDLDAVEPSVAGPRRPQDRVPLAGAAASFAEVYPRDPSPVRLAGAALVPEGASSSTAVLDAEAEIDHGAVVIAAITSCTNTSNPSVMVAAGLLARNAVARGLETKPWVKTSLAPGSRVVTDYLDRAGLTEPLEKLRFNLVGYGCTTCIGNSGPLPDALAAAISEHDLAVVSVLSGNRNFEGRIHPQVRASYLASPPLVVAYALAGSIGVDLEHEPLGTDGDGADVFLRDIWPSPDEVRDVIASAIDASLYEKEYARVFAGDEHWREMPAPEGGLFAWDASSTYVQEPPYFVDLPAAPAPLADIEGARVLAVLGDSVTTDHISPAGSIKADGPAGLYLQEHGVEPRDFNSYGSRRGNHEVMIRGTFANIRLRNALAGGVEGGVTRHLPSGDLVSIFDAAERYRAEGVPLVVLAGKEYGSGSSRDWAAKGTLLLGVRAVIAESYERIHRSNLVGMGVLPLQFMPGESAATYALSGEEVFSIRDLGRLVPGQKVTVEAIAPSGFRTGFAAIARVDGPAELEYLRHGGILPMVLRRMIAEG
jgi:aconitate hydratase A / 2-methylisocitrate dehydratase